MKPKLVTIPNVPLIGTGIDYPLSTGPVTFTEDDLRDIIASQDDSAIRSPRLKLSRVNAHAEAINEPAFGVATNLRLVDNDQMIMCDYEGVPEWLADVMPVAYPSRSIEAILAAETVTGKKYRVVVTAVQLLGVEWPGVSVLADLPLYYGDEMPENVTVAAAEGIRKSEKERSMGVNAAVNLDDVRREYYQMIEDVPGCGWWWIRAVQLNPMELIVDNDDGVLYRVPFSVKNDKITYAEPTEVKIEYVDIAASSTREERTAATSAFAAGLLATAEEPPAVVFATRAESRPVVQANQEGDEATVDIAKLRASLGMPETATEDEVLAKVTELHASASGAPESEVAVEVPAVTPEAQGSALPEGMVLVDQETLNSLQAGAASGVRVEQRILGEENDRILLAAVKEGRIMPSRKEAFAKMLEADREGTIKLLTASAEEGGLAPGLIPVDQRGTTGGTGGVDGQEIVVGEGEGLPDNWFPDITARRVAAQAVAGTPSGSGQVLQSKEG